MGVHVGAWIMHEGEWSEHVSVGGFAERCIAAQPANTSGRACIYFGRAWRGPASSPCSKAVAESGGTGQTHLQLCVCEARGGPCKLQEAASDEAELTACHLRLGIAEARGADGAEVAVPEHLERPCHVAVDLDLVEQPQVSLFCTTVLMASVVCRVR